MRVYDICNAEGAVIAFEVPNCGRHRAQRLVRRIPGATVVRCQRRFQVCSDEQFCEFELGGRRFLLWEPWNDNSRFWIGEEPARASAQLDRLRTAFAEFRRYGLW